MKKEHSITIIFLFIVWFCLSLFINNDILLPNPLVVLNIMFNQLMDISFYMYLFNSLIRMFKGIGISILLALLLGILGNRYKFIDKLFEPIEVLLKTIPNISYIILSIIWLGQEGSVTLVTSLVVFPILYTNIKNGLIIHDSDLIDVIKIYPEKYSVILKQILIPNLLPQLIIGIKSSVSLGFKVGIMAEILGQVNNGIGKQLYYAKINLDMNELFAYTIWIIVIGAIIDFIFVKILQKLKNLIF